MNLDAASWNAVEDVAEIKRGIDFMYYWPVGINFLDGNTDAAREIGILRDFVRKGRPSPCSSLR